MLGQAERLYELKALMKPNTVLVEDCQIISFTSGKGGTGKSFIASNIAFSLAETGARVLLVDLDINLANQNVIFNITSKKSIYHYLTFNKTLEDIIYQYSDNLHLIFGESGKLDHPKINSENVKSLVSELGLLSRNYDFIIFDTASGIENGTLQLLAHSDQVILVTSPEPTSVMDGYVIFKLLKNMGIKTIINVIVNKCLNQSDGDDTYKNLAKATEHFLKIDINYLGKLSFSDEVLRSIQNQNLLTKNDKSSHISEQIGQITSKLKNPTIG